MRHHSFMRWASAAMAALMFFQCTTPVAFATDDTILAESSIAVSSADSESVPVDSDAGYIPERPPENTSVDSSSNDAASSEPLIGDSSASSELPEDASSNGSVESQPESDTDQISTSDETTDSELAESSSENTDESAKSLYQDGKILIYTCDQLAEIGSGQTLTDASGLAVTDENGAEITYALDAQYAIAEDIELTGDMLQWQLPEGFSGSITPLAESSDDLTLYDAQSDTIYLYNPYQMAVLHGENPDTEPVMDGDAQAATFGSGQLIYPNGESEPYLTYSSTHHYVLSKQFSSEVSAQPYSVTVTEGKADGRDFPGQVIKELNGKTYILIGNEQQLRKIGSGDTVYGAVYQAIHHNAQWTIDHDSSGNLIMLYGGDADLTKGQNGTDDYTLGKDGIHEADKKFSDKANNLLYVYTVGRCGVNQKTGEIDPNLDIDKAANQTYAANANYIIFRDIDLSTKEWTPLTFQGTMIGAKSANGEKIWNDDSSAINTSTKPTISNVSVMQTGKLNVGEQMGVGFFSTISSEVSENDIGLSKGLVQVSNLKFQNISVQTTTSETYYPETLVSTLTSTLGKLLGGLVSGLTFILTFGQVKVDLGKTLGDVLDARKKDPTALATGAIAGRVEGQVEFSGIEVAGATVKNVNNNTGGFVGYTVGVTQYDGLSHALGDLVKLLTNILNVIPGLGLGDLITILLGNAIPLGKLIPTGYINAQFADCSIDGLNISTSIEKDYAGGFVGQQSGSIIESCTVKNSSLSLQGKNFVGGFVGLARDSIIKGTLSGALDIETKLPKMNPESLLLNCTLDNTVINIQGENYAGGFAGGLANTAAVNCSAAASKSLTVHATKANAGGFAGIATLGWAANLGKDDKNNDLLGGVVDLVVKLLSSNPGAVSSLLSLAGVNPSYILGCTVDAPLTVNGTDYVGGVTGRGDGAYIAPSSADYLSKVSYWRNNIYTADKITEQNVSFTGVGSISGHNYVGGIAGSLGTASVAGLLNTTLGVASYLAFTVDSVTLNGAADGFAVSGTERVGGGFGEAIGGSVTNVSVNNLASVTGENLVGGFIGLSGPGELVGSDGGLTVNLLGLNYLLKLNNLLSLGQAVEVTITNANVKGIESGFTVEATGVREENSVRDYTASGFMARSNSTKVENAHVTNLKSVTAANDGGYAAGFVAISKTGGLAEVGDDNSVKSLLEANGLVNAIGYLIPSYTNCTVAYVDGGSVTGDVAGGFAADFQSGTVNNQARGESDYYAVYNLGSVNGQSYAGGFAGRAYSGALADASKGISILGSITGLNINLTDLLSVINAYVPYIQYAGVKSDNGFTVMANKLTEDTTVGSAGGFVGYASGAQISYSDVTKLKHTIVTPPDNLEDTSAPTYYDNTKSTYAVTGGRYAGGYVGDMDIGSAASVGGGLQILGNTIQLTNVLDALSVVVTTIEHSDVTGETGGFAILATGDLGNSKGKVGMSGGYAGGVYGGHIQDCQAVNFSYIIGEIAAGGYVGELEPGDVASLLNNGSILSKVVDIDSVLASVLQSFVPSIRNSSTNCVPCGGAVRANAASDTTVQRGMAGGYVGHNMGGTIHGFDTSTRKKEYDEGDTKKTYNGPTSVCKAERIRSVYGFEYAGGYTGLMEPADTAKLGSVSALMGLISIKNILGALGVIYPVQTNTAVYGPLAGLDVDTWNSWVEYVGKYGGYGYELAKKGTVATQAELDALLAEMIYGYNVVAGRSEFNNMLYGGDAGGYVGCMNSGTLTNCMAYDAKLVSALHSAGGFAGQMKTGGAAQLGTVSILGLNLNLDQLLNIAQLFVPAVRNSSVQGYKSGLTVQATGLPENHCGYSGGFVGSAYGAQIQLNGEEKLPTTDQWSSTDKYAAPVASCNATNLRRVTGRIAVGGYVGLASAGSVAGVNTNASNGLLQGILDHLIATPGDLATVLKATATTIHAATVSAADSQWGFVVDGAYKEGGIVKYAAYAGGFAGSLEASAVGEENSTSGKVQIENLRSVDGGKYAGGFFGLADVAGVAQVSGRDPNDSETKLLSDLIRLGNTSVLAAFRTYIYDSKVTGVQSGLTVQAHSGSQEATQSETRYTGCAGGFGGGMMDGSVKNSAVSNLANVEGLNYTGGFVGHLGKSGVADIDDVNVLDKLLSGTVGALDLFGSHVENCSVSGFGLGTVIKAQGGQQPIAGGFAGYADLAKINGCSTTALKQVTSGQIAGGFIGKTDMNYVVSAELQSRLLNIVFTLVNKLLSILYVGDLQNLGVLDVDLGWVLTVKLLADGKTLAVSLLGLQIGVALNKATEPGQSDLAIITIGDSVIELPCTEQGIDQKNIPNVKINLIKGNRTDIDGCSVTGISAGYDVFAGGARNDADGTDKEGYSGGFIGLNHEGQVKNSTMTLCDVVRGTENLVGPFTGVNDLKSVYSFNTIKSIEGNNNHYSIYRAFNEALKNVAKANKDVFGSAEKDTSTGTDYNRYEVLHLDKITEFSDLKDAKMEDAAANTTADLAAYASPAKAVLMLDTANTDNPDSTITEPADTADPCKKYVDLTISKIWKDFANIDGKRPNEIKVNICQQEFKPDGTAGNKTLYKAIIMTKDDVESGHASTWRTVLKNAPVLKYQKAADGTVTDTIEAYYVYLFEEETVPGYTLTGSTYDEKTYHATITNTHHPMLPDTGSTGDWLYVVVGVGILLLALSVPRKRKGRREAH
jgi:LPXTG-motif cell wall-anchored protein